MDFQCAVLPFTTASPVAAASTKPPQKTRQEDRGRVNRPCLHIFTSTKKPIKVCRYLKMLLIGGTHSNDVWPWTWVGAVTCWETCVKNSNNVFSCLFIRIVNVNVEIPSYNKLAEISGNHWEHFREFISRIRTVFWWHFMTVEKFSKILNALSCSCLHISLLLYNLLIPPHLSCPCGIH